MYISEPASHNFTPEVARGVVFSALVYMCRTVASKEPRKIRGQYADKRILIDCDQSAKAPFFGAVSASSMWAACQATNAHAILALSEEQPLCPD